MRKEYNDRNNAPLVNPGLTIGEYEALRSIRAVSAAVSSTFSKEDVELIEQFQSMLDARDLEQAAHFAKVQERSAK